MKNKYKDLIEQTFDFPQDEFSVEDNELNLYDIPLMEIIKQYGTPLKVTYLPKISSQIARAKRMFNVAMAKVDYKGAYNYCYCTKSSHFSFVLEEALKNDIHLETSSAYDIHIINALYDGGIIDKDRYIICNGFKRPQYVENIAQLVNDGFSNTIPVLDNKEELELFEDSFTKKCKVGIRIACEEEPSSTSTPRGWESATTTSSISTRQNSATARNSSSRCCISSSTPASRTRPTTGTSCRSA